MQDIIEIGWGQLALFSLILLIPVGIDRAFKLGLLAESAVSIARMTVQLALVGLYLEFLFELNSVWVNLAWLAVMLVVGSRAISRKAKLRSWRVSVPVFCGLSLGVLPLVGLMLFGLLQPAPWHHAQYLIPLAGMLLGNSLSANIVALQHLFGAFEQRELEYHGALSLGAAPGYACFPFVQAAMRQSFAPILASMSATGLVTLPGMMTGQILGGTSPLLAIKYQLVIMLAIFVMLFVSVAVCLSLSVRSLLNDSGRLLVRRDV